MVGAVSTSPDPSGSSWLGQKGSLGACNGIALSGYGTQADIARSKGAGFMAHLTKPVTAAALDEALTRFTTR